MASLSTSDKAILKITLETNVVSLGEHPGKLHTDLCVLIWARRFSCGAHGWWGLDQHIHRADLPIHRGQRGFSAFGRLGCFKQRRAAD